VRTGAQTERETPDVRISAIADLSTDALRKSWRARFGNDPPSIRSRTILAHLLAWRIQIDAIGGLDNATTRSLTKIAEALERDGTYEPKIRKGFSAGVVLSREWKGVVHRVTVTEDGFQHLGKRHRSLSDIARNITGTHWSGPRFFGLEQKERASRVVAP
jgi:hypothetical protein